MGIHSRKNKVLRKSRKLALKRLAKTRYSSCYNTEDRNQPNPNQPQHVSEIVESITDLPALEVESVPSETYEDTQKIYGRRIVDIIHVFNSLKKIQHKGFGCCFFNADIIAERRFGLRSVFYPNCKVCNLKSSFSSEDETNVDVNQAAVSGALAAGIGCTQFTELCAALDIPKMSTNTYLKNQEIVRGAVDECVWESMLEAGREEVRLAHENNNVDNEGTPLISVIVDGDWSKRSYRRNYNASSGVAAIIGVATKKVLYIGVKNKYCSMCARYTAKKESIPNHRCFKNWSGSSTGMEAALILDGFKCSVDVHGVKYNKMIGDGDSSVYRTLKDAKPYGPSFFIQKIECRNHILRNYCNHIQDLYKTTKKDSITTFILQNILRLRSAIVKAANYHRSRNLPVHNKIIDLKQDIMNGPKHIMGDHTDCQKYFCNGPKAQEKELYSLFKLHSTFMRFQIIISRVANHSSSLLENVDTNDVENLNSIINKLVGGKRINFSQKGNYQTILKQSTSANSDYGDIPEDDIQSNVLEDLKKNYLAKLAAVDISKLEEDTKGQNSNPRWLAARSERLTASNFGKVCKMRSTTFTANMVKTILYPPTLNHSAPIQYGKSNEDRAIQMFEEKTGLKIERCGLFVDQDNKYLGASPDGLVGGNANIEVKCSYSGRYGTVYEGILNKAIKYLEIVDNTIKVKKRHDYYYQVQGQLHISKRELCYFVVYTNVDLEIITIPKDEHFWLTEMEPKLTKFFIGAILPEIIDSRRSRNLPLSKLFDFFYNTVVFHS